jgi:hypothetical protein
MAVLTVEDRLGGQAAQAIAAADEEDFHEGY